MVAAGAAQTTTKPGKVILSCLPCLGENRKEEAIARIQLERVWADGQHIPMAQGWPGTCQVSYVTASTLYHLHPYLSSYNFC